MSIQTWQETLACMPSTGATLAATTSQTSLIGSGAASAVGKASLPPNFFNYAGKTVRVTAGGRMSTVVTTPGTFTFFLTLGAVNAASTGAIALNTTAQTNQTWDLEWLLTCVSVGSGTAATLMHQAKFISRTSLNAPAVGTTNGVGVVLCPDTSPSAGTGFDGTASQVVDLQGQWSVSSASNSIQLIQYRFEAMN